ncbi:MAG: formylglycine-generating enzyme family protein [Treponema sp.]|nr:formylglycine-generating enzyme family protein [Treponema sp.]
MKQHNTIYQLGMIILALCVLYGCSYPTETIYQEIPIEVPVEAPKEEESEITGFTFTQVNPLRAAQSGSGALVGSLSDPTGGTPPFTYLFVRGAGGEDNWRFAISDDSLTIRSGPLAAGTYSVCLGVTDSKGLLYTRTAEITIAPDYTASEEETQTVKRVDFKMRYVPSGAFIKPGEMMGDPDIKVSIFGFWIFGFWMAETEVTQELYEAVMGKNPSHFKNDAAPGEMQIRRPVESVTWYEAVLFCNRLSIMTGKEAVYQVWSIPDWEDYLTWAISTFPPTAADNIYEDEKADGYRLPTTDEWLWAAMGADIQNPGEVNTTGAKKYYSGGPVESREGIENFAWVNSNSSDITHEVGKKASNELGLFDMTGNVSEWTWGLVRGSSSPYFYNRGQHWGYGGYDPLYSYTSYGIPNTVYRDVGFRIVRNQ